MKDEEEEQKLHELEQIIEEEVDVREVVPIAAPEIKREGLEFARQANRDILRPPPPPSRTDQEIIQAPNLQIDAGQEFLYMAQ